MKVCDLFFVYSAELRDKEAGKQPCEEMFCCCDYFAPRESEIHIQNNNARTEEYDSIKNSLTVIRNLKHLDVIIRCLYSFQQASPCNPRIAGFCQIVPGRRKP